jgi:hypothetical protein
VEVVFLCADTLFLLTPVSNYPDSRPERTSRNDHPPLLRKQPSDTKGHGASQTRTWDRLLVSNESEDEPMLRKWLRETPKGILVIAIPWFIAAFLLATIWVACIAESIPASPWELGNVNDRGESVVLLELVSYTPVLLLLGFVIGAFFVAVGLLRKTRSAVHLARCLSAAWILYGCGPLLVDLIDPYARIERLSVFCCIGCAVYNFWSWWYLSRAGLQEKLRPELIFLNLH